MISRKFTLFAFTLLTGFVVCVASCKKINESTLLGDDLIPAVDNITTFDTTLTVEAFNDIFSLTNPANGPDSIALVGSETHFLGNITADPLFGTSSGAVFMQLKPTTFKLPFEFKTTDSLIGIDSIVLALKYVKTYGDTNAQQAVTVYEIDQTSDFRWDSLYRVRENNITYTNFLGTRTYVPADLNDSLKLFLDTALTTNNQLRIKLDNSFGQRLLEYDSSLTGPNNAYQSDSIFNTLFKGFAIIPGGTGNALVGIVPSGSKLSIYYKYKKNGIDSTTVTDFAFLTTSARSNYIQRDYSGGQIASYLDPSTPQEFVYIQTQPGTFATVKVPGLAGLNNRVIHRAELILEQATYDVSTDGNFTIPTLFLDYFDSAASRYAVSKLDFGASANTSTGGYSFNSDAYGMNGKSGFDVAGALSYTWRFDISRWVQGIVTGREKYYPLRLYAPYETKVVAAVNGLLSYTTLYPLNPSIAAGRVRLFGGTPTTNDKRMRVRIVYSKI